MQTMSARLGAMILTCGAALVGAAGIAGADEWQPRRAIEIVVPSAPGGGLDLAGRTLQGVVEQDQLSSKPMTVLNRPGGSGTVGIAYINSHEGDGHYAVVQALPLITNRLTGQSEIGLDDVTPLAQLLTEQVIFSVAADSPIKTGQDLVAELRKDPAGVSVGVSSSPGGQSHIAAALVLKAAGEDPTKLKIVFFDSGGEAATALMGGHITVAVTPAAVVLGPSKAGKLRMIALPAETRQKGDLAGVPTWKEQGIDVEFSTWRVLVGPKGMTPEEIAWWDDTLGKATSSPEWAAAVDRNLWTADYKNSKDVRSFLVSEQTRLAELLKELGLAK
ncbi:MAG TPA: tripartite tricarboxylate transporter substrate binding protein [Candidatus Angelobacter sp.]|nr:tripartite tricarboxylate transporter substrate binding protein [Candidatus Angelobacter sp.]